MEDREEIWIVMKKRVITGMLISLILCTMTACAGGKTNNGTEDEIAYDSAAAAAKNLPEVCDKFRDGENFEWQELSGAHDFNIWYLGFYNFAQIAFQEQ